MRFVDYDRAAADRASAACRTAADDLRAAARLLGHDGVGAHLEAWAGSSRIEFDGTADDIAASLRHEADELEATADEIDAATASAARTETDRREAHEAELRRQREAREALPEGVR